MKKKFLAAAIGAMLVGGSASAVQISSNGIGDFLIAPAYFIGGDMSTKLRVINTSTTLSTVAKVIFRHPVSSAETLDFLIYLSPGDVWVADVSCLASDAAGNCTTSQVKSADDSMATLNSTVFGSVDNAAVVISNGADGRAALPNQGYIEIIESKVYTAAQLALFPDAAYKGMGQSKNSIYRAYQADITNGIVPNGDVTKDDNPDILTGTVTAVSASSGSATLPMLAISGFDTVQLLKPNDETSLMNTTGHAFSDLEDALWSNNYVIPYKVAADAVTLVTFAFPTKLTYAGVAKPGQYTFGSQVCLSGVAYDNSENSIATLVNVSPRPKGLCVDETGWVFVGSKFAGFDVGSFTEGWINLRYVAPTLSVGQGGTNGFWNAKTPTNAGRSGAPGIVTVMNKQPGNFTWAYPASVK